jgi:ABC-type transport system involved in multi-copper enzyme maturation permease subunit
MTGSGFFVAFLIQTPVYLVWLVGVILAIVRWKKHPSVSLVALIAFVMLFLLAMVTLLIAAHNGVKVGHPGITFLEALIRAGAWGLVLAAVFGWRK